MTKLVPALAAAALVCLVTPTAATASGSSCPPGNSGFVLWDVTAEPYAVDNMVDERGNNDGWVCAQPKEIVTDENGNPFQIYNFIENRVPAR